MHILTAAARLENSEKKSPTLREFHFSFQVCKADVAVLETGK
jgi:hypothetical protein